LFLLLNQIVLEVETNVLVTAVVGAPVVVAAIESSRRRNYFQDGLWRSTQQCNEEEGEVADDQFFIDRVNI
jgi:hypothetical protein